MKEENKAILKEFLDVYGVTPRPKQFGNPHHCEECEEANALLSSKGLDDVELEEIEEPSIGWFYSWIGSDGFAYFLPGVCKKVMEDPERSFETLLDFVDKPWLKDLTYQQSTALLGFLDYGQDCGFLNDTYERENLSRIIGELKTQQGGGINSVPLRSTP